MLFLGLRSSRREIFTAAALAISIFATILSGSGQVIHVLVLMMIVVTGALLASLAPNVLFNFYFLWLFFEGALKMCTHYNPIIHIGSDLLFLVVFCRLLNRASRDPVAVTGKISSGRNSITTAILIFWLWVALQFLNPWGLGILPSLAGLKIYAIPILVFFTVAFLLRDEEVRLLPYFILGISIVEALVGVIDWWLGPSFLGALSSQYLQVLNTQLPGLPYRPFGTTAIPGAPSVWVAQSIVAALMVSHLQSKPKEEIPNQPPRAHQLWSSVLRAYVPLALICLIICQVRVTMLRWVLVGFAGLLLRGGKTAVNLLFLVGVLAICFRSYDLEKVAEDRRTHTGVTERAAQALSRIRTLENTETYAHARSASWYWKEATRRASVTLQGIGLSRISASSRPWEDLIRKDPYFSQGWRFADSLYLALFTELGVGGLLAYLFMMLTVVGVLLGTRSYVGRLVAVNALVVLLSSYATEGLLYQPEASLFWLYAGLGLRLCSR